MIAGRYPSNEEFTDWLELFPNILRVSSCCFAACATAVSLADKGQKVLLISTDPASNLQDNFAMELTNKGTAIQAVPLFVSCES